MSEIEDFTIYIDFTTLNRYEHVRYKIIESLPKYVSINLNLISYYICYIYYLLCYVYSYNIVKMYI